MEDKTQSKPDDATAKEGMKTFLDSFEASSRDLEKQLTASANLSVDELPRHFTIISGKLQELQSSLSDSIKFMLLYDIRICQEKMKHLQDELDKQQSNLLPKKKFAFKNRKKETEKSVKVPVSDTIDGTEQFVDKGISCGFENKFNEKLEKSGSEISNKDVGLRNLDNCEVVLRGSASTMHASALRNCRVFCGPVGTSVFVEDCKDCVFVLSCQQLRIHSSADCEFYLRITCGPIIEDCIRMGFAPCEFTEHDSETKDEANNWGLVNDFNWLAADMPSPNWHVISPVDRKQLFSKPL